MKKLLVISLFCISLIHAGKRHHPQKKKKKYHPINSVELFLLKKSYKIVKFPARKSSFPTIIPSLGSRFAPKTNKNRNRINRKKRKKTAHCPIM